MYVLTVLRGPDQGKEFELPQGQAVTVGSGDDAIALTDPRILSPHCALLVQGEEILLENKTASAGTYVGDRKIARGRIRPGASFRIGDTVLAVKKVAPRKPAAPSQADEGPDPLLGKVIGGYKINEIVGRGGMGTVYKATQLSLHRDVALKVLRPRLAKDKNFRDLFINEARAAAQLVDPNVVQVYDAGIEGDISFFSMEFIGRGSVEEILEKQDVIPWEEAILMVLEAAHGLRYAETRGIVHRDIKPDNLMINDDGRIKIADLGLAKKGESGKDAGIIGTPHFIPPEQALGKDVDTRADIYSLGCTFFRMITGKTVFTGKTAKEIVLKHIKEPPPAASSVDSSVPDDLDIAIARMLAKDPGQRYADAQELISELEAVCAHHGIKGAVIQRGVGKRVLIPLILLLIAGAAVIWWLAMREQEPSFDPAQEAARIKAEQEAAKAAREAAKAQWEQTKIRVENQWRDLQSRYYRRLAENPINDTYDEDTTAAALESAWLELATAIENFAADDESKEFQPGLVAEASKLAKSEIRDKLVQLKKNVTHKRQWKDERVAKAKDIDEKQRLALGALLDSRRYQAAYDLCGKLTPKRPSSEDPFNEIVSATWISPDNSLKLKATTFKEIMAVVNKAREYFKGEQKLIPKRASQAWESVKARVTSLPANADEEAVADAIAELTAVQESFVDDGALAAAEPTIRAIAEQAHGLKQSLSLEIEKRNRERLDSDRMLVRNALRKYASLDPEVYPNRLMNLEIPEARVIWTRLLREGEGGVQTERYRNYVQQRIDMLDWIQFLFRRFRNDTIATLDNRNSGPLGSLEMELEKPEGGRALRIKLKTPPDNEFRFSFSPGFKGETERGFGQLPLNWVHAEVFHHKGELRWREVDPVVRFALGAFCYETMQFGEAKKHFDALAGDARYGDAARALSARAAQEATALDAYFEIIGRYAKATTSAGVDQAIQDLNAFYKRFETMRFYIEVMRSGDTVRADFVDDKRMPRLPKAPEE